MAYFTINQYLPRRPLVKGYLCHISAYIKIESHTQPPGEESISKLWIIGAVAGPIVAIILIVWLVLCMYIKCCRSPPPQKLEEGGEPQLTSIKNTETQVSKTLCRKALYCKYRTSSKDKWVKMTLGLNRFAKFDKNLEKHQTK